MRTSLARISLAGIRKQSCVLRRCKRMHGHGSSVSYNSPPAGPSTPQYELLERNDEQNLFWTAVAGCMAIGNQGDDNDSHADHFNRGGVAFPLDAFHALRRLGGGDEGTEDSSVNESSSDNSSFCFKLASILVRAFSSVHCSLLSMQLAQATLHRQL